MRIAREKPRWFPLALEPVPEKVVQVFVDGERSEPELAANTRR